MKRSIATIYLLAITILTAMAQTRPQHSLYMTNNIFLNPAVAGVENYSILQAGTRLQWTGVNGAPATYWAAANLSFRKSVNPTEGMQQYERPSVDDRGHGLGVMLYQDNIGPYRTLNLNAAYAYHLPLSSSVALSLGFSGGLQTVRYDMSGNIYPDQPNDPAIAEQANALYRKVTPDLNAGLLLYGKQFFGGLSMLQIIPAQYMPSSKEHKGANYVQQLLLSAGYSFDLDDGGTKLWLSGMLKNDFASPLRYDLNVKLSFADIFWLGGSYRKDDAVSGNVCINISPAFGIIYNYDYSLLNLMSQYSRGSHEFSLRFKLLRPGQYAAPKIGW